eukprot:7933241-Pyramimonas_sp.AAC.1
MTGNWTVGSVESDEDEPPKDLLWHHRAHCAPPRRGENIPALPVSDWSIVHRRGVGRWGQPIPPLDRASDWSIVRIYPCFMGLIGSSCTAAAWRGGINLFPPSTGHLIGPS